MRPRLPQRFRRWRAARRTPTLSVIVPVYNVAAYLPECLDSLLAQTLTDLEVVAVDDGSTDECPRILAEYARRDRRVRVVRQENAGQGAARNRGVELARAEFISFVDSDDTIPLDAFAHMVGVLRASGSDFCVGRTRRMTDGRFQPVGWNRFAHDRDRIGITIDEHPLALRDIIAGNRVIRREFWIDRVPAFEPGIAYEDHVPMLMAYVRAERFDLLARATYNWRFREDNTSTGQQKADIANLRDRIAVKEQAHDLLLAEASPTTYDAWIARCVASDFMPYAVRSFAASDDYRELLAGAYTTLLERATPRTLLSVGPAAKVVAWLIARRRWDDAEQAHAWMSDRQVPRPTSPVGDGLAVVRPAHLDLDDVPAELWLLAEQDVRARAAVRGVRAIDPDTLGVYVVTWIHRVEDPGAPPTVDAVLVEAGTGVRIPVPTTVSEDADARVWAADAVTDARPGVVRLAIDAGRLTPGTWSVELRVTQAGLTRTTDVTGRVAGAVPATLAPVDLADLRITPRLDPGEALTLGVELRPAAVGASAADRLLDVRAGAGVLDLLHAGSSTTSLTGPRTIAPTVQEADRTRFPIVDAAGLAAPSGRYLLADGPERVDDELVGRLPLTRHGDVARAELSLLPSGQPCVTLAAPLTDAERNPARRARSAATYVDTAEALRHDLRHDLRHGTVLFLSDEGRSATGDPAAIDAELARTHPELRRIWAVRDQSVPTPAGAQRVVVDSDAWWTALATARWIVVDASPGPWFRRREGQQTVLTGRGRPTKSMGFEQWRLEGRSPADLERTSAAFGATWTTLLAPDEAAAELYRHTLGYRGRVLAAGAPRTDRLAHTDDRSMRRSALLAQWGIDPSRTVILVAPTYRDATPRVGARRQRSLPTRGVLPPLDLARLAAGTGAVVLLRAHRFDAEAAARAAAGLPDVVDLTAHPDPVDVLLAADAAVLDYSAIRFDWGLTDRPAVFFAPDRDVYFQRRPGLVPYADSAPGPVVESTDEAVALLQDLPALAERSAAQRADFNRRFNANNDGGAAARVVDALFSA